MEDFIRLRFDRIDADHERRSRTRYLVREMLQIELQMENCLETRKTQTSFEASRINARDIDVRSAM